MWRYWNHSNYEGFGDFMKLVLKLLAVPFALVLTVASAVLTFAYSASAKLFSAASGLIFIGAVLLLVTGERSGGAAFMIAAFLVSPLGIHAFAGGLIKLLGNAGGALRGFIISG